MVAHGQTCPCDGMLAPCENMGYMTERGPASGRGPPAEVAPWKGSALRPLEAASPPAPPPAPRYRTTSPVMPRAEAECHVTRMSQREVTERTANQKGGRGCREI